MRSPPPPQRKPLLPEQLARLGPRQLLVSEFFTSIQGESTFAGQRCFFVRLTGCHLRCTWCDSEYAFYGGTETDVEECVRRADASGCQVVEVTGGEPLLQRGALPLLSALCDGGYTVLLETSGSVPLRRVDARVRKIVDVKAPASGMERYNLRFLARQLGALDEVKVVLADRSDFDWACRWVAASGLAERVPIHFSPVHETLPPAQLAEWIVAECLPVRLNLQLHKYLWPERDRGV